MEYAISLQNVTKRYGSKNVVQNVSLHIEQGELFGLLGVNGAGKSTIINMLCGLTEATTGDITILGHDIAKELQKVKPVLGLSPQQTAIAPNLTVYENLALFGGIHGFSKQELKDKIAEIVATFSLEPYLKQKSKTLSGGWQRKLSIAIALITEPKILFLDEPTLGLDILGRRELWKLIEAIKHKTTIILTTHYLEEAESLCDRICIMKDGEIKAIGNVETLNKQANCDNFEDTFVAFVTGGAQ